MSPADLVGREYDVRVERLGGGGEGIASIDGLVTFVRGALPGETARVRVTKAYASYAAAELVELTDAAPERTAPACPLFGRCGGCALMHMSYRRELEYKQKLVADALERVGGFQDVGVADVLGDFGPDGADFSPRYRNKGQYAVSPSAIGFVAAGSHTVVGVDDCLLQKPGGALILREISAWIGAFGIGPAELTDIVIRTGEHTGEVMVVLVSQTGRLRGLGALADRLFCAVPGLRSLTVNHNPIPRGARKRPALGAKLSLAAGDPTIRDTLSGLSFSISPAAFFQVNTRMAERLCDQILALSGVTPADTVFDLYCGVGSISLCLARGADNVIGVEVSQTAVADAREMPRGTASKIRPSSRSARKSVLRASAGTASARISSYSTRRARAARRRSSTRWPCLGLAGSCMSPASPRRSRATLRASARRGRTIF
jgi:23S rRNA (uracil1939-C5)-methyltransferase